MYDWWIMPVFAVLFLIVVLFIVSRFFGGGWFCGRPRTDRTAEDEEIKDLKKEIREIKDEIRELKKEKTKQ